MKTIILVTALVLGTIQTYANQVIINGFVDKYFTVQIQNQKFQSRNGQVIISNLYTGEYRVKIASVERRNGASYKEVNFAYIQVPARGNVTYNLTRHNDLVLDVPAPCNDRPAQSHPSNNHHNSYERPQQAQSSCNRYEPNEMSARDFEFLMNDLNRISFNSDRFDAVKREMRYNNFTANQIADLMTLFDFEEYRLKIAKLGYSKTVDQYNYRVVYNELSFRSSAEELDYFIDQENTQYSYNQPYRYDYRR